MKSKKVITVLLLAVLLISALCAPAFAITESEVEAQVAASGKEAVTGNVLIWFLCAVAFLKVSQKIDSFMATLGVNVGRTGGSMLAEAMIAMRSVTMVMGGGRGAGAGRASPTSSGAAGKAGSSGMAGFFKGGLIGMAGRHITNSAVKTATTQTSAVHTAQGSVAREAAAAAAQTATGAHINGGGSPIHTKNAVPTGTPPQEGAVVPGGGFAPQAAPMENAPSTSPVPNGMPPQEGTILTGSEPPPSIPQVDPEPQSVDAPIESIPPDMTPPQEGVIVAGGDTSIQASQHEDVFPGGPSSQGAAAGMGGGPAQVHTERVSQSVHTPASSEKVQTSRFHTSEAGRPTLGGMVFSRSLAAGGSFANDVIGTVARGEVAGSITGDMAAQSLASYMGQVSPGIGGGTSPAYSDVEIGRGRITGVETAAGAAEGQAFAMYHVEQYAAPSGEYSKVVSADGTQWYKQRAQDAVERKPYMAPDDTVAYHERIIKKLPDPPKRKDRI